MVALVLAAASSAAGVSVTGWSVTSESRVTVPHTTHYLLLLLLPPVAVGLLFT